jgi:hypothetical protein
VATAHFSPSERAKAFNVTGSNVTVQIDDGRGSQRE